jgi:hypothetical protein
MEEALPAQATVKSATPWGLDQVMAVIFTRTKRANNSDESSAECVPQAAAFGAECAVMAFRLLDVLLDVQPAWSREDVKTHICSDCPGHFKREKGAFITQSSFAKLNRQLLDLGLEHVCLPEVLV